MNTDFTEIKTIKWNVGSHTPFSNNIYDTIYNSVSRGMTCCQFFLGNPKRLKRKTLDKCDINKTRNLISRFPMNVYSHFPYISNLAGSTKTLAWSGCNIQDDKTNNLIKSLEYEINTIRQFGDKNGVVIHPGNYKDRKLGLYSISKSINKIDFKKGSMLLLENSAGQGCSLATTFEEIRDIINNIEESKKKHIGVCLDTAHIYGYGEYDISKSYEIDRMFKEFDNIIGLDKLKLVHLNDSKAVFGSKRDLHELLGIGNIWRESFDSLIKLLNLCEKYYIPVILETNMSDMQTLAVLSEKYK